MSAFELAVAVIFACLGIRSLVHWAIAPYESTRASDLALYAAFVTARVGMWLVLATAFTLYAIRDTDDGFAEEGFEHPWLFMVFLGLGGVQLVTSYVLSQRAKGR